MKTPEIKALASKTLLFSLVAVFFWMLSPNVGFLTYATLLVLAILWLGYEVAQPQKRKILKQALLLGLFLMAFDFVVENAGFFAGQWTSPQSIFLVIAVPIEIIALTIIGGTAWALHLPEKFDRTYAAIEVIIFGTFGALGEYLLMLNGMMVYTGGWTSIHAFFGYVITWIILFWVWYKIIRGLKI